MFSGIGGGSLGLERAGMQTVAFCENNDFCQQVLSKHWPHIPIHSDIEDFDGHQYQGSVDLIFAGWPCQPWSVAGRRLGSKDNRHLWPEVHRIIRQVQPRWFIGENVPGLVRLGLDPALSDLEDEGYTSQTFNIGAIAVDAPHIRQRIFIISHKNVADSESQRVEGRGSTGQQESHLSAQSVLSGRNSSGSGTSVWSPQPKFCRIPYGVSRWLDEPEGLKRLVKGCPDRTKRIKALGNAVVPQVVEVLGKFIMEIHHNNGHSTEDGD